MTVPGTLTDTVAQRDVVDRLVRKRLLGSCLNVREDMLWHAVLTAIDRLDDVELERDDLWRQVQELK